MTLRQKISLGIFFLFMVLDAACMMLWPLLHPSETFSVALFWLMIGTTTGSFLLFIVTMSVKKKER